MKMKNEYIKDQRSKSKERRKSQYAVAVGSDQLQLAVAVDSVILSGVEGCTSQLAAHNSVTLCGYSVTSVVKRKENLTTENTEKTQRNAEKKELTAGSFKEERNLTTEKIIEACHFEGGTTATNLVCHLEESMTERSVTFQQISNRFLSSFGMTAGG